MLKPLVSVAMPSHWSRPLPAGLGFMGTHLAFAFSFIQSMHLGPSTAMARVSSGWPVICCWSSMNSTMLSTS